MVKHIFNLSSSQSEDYNMENVHLLINSLHPNFEYLLLWYQVGQKSCWDLIFPDFK